MIKTFAAQEINNLGFMHGILFIPAPRDKIIELNTSNAACIS